MICGMDKELRELVEGAEERASKATEGPLEGVFLESFALPNVGSTRGAVVLNGVCELIALVFGKPEIATRDAEFFAAARQDVPALCAAVRRLDAEREKERAAWAEYAIALAHRGWLAEYSLHDSDEAKNLDRAEEDFARARGVLVDLGVDPSLLVD